MAVCIRLKRSGRKHLPFYHICVFNSRTRRDGRPIEQLGFYDPTSNNEEKLRIDMEKVKYWVSQGAKPSETVASLLRKQGMTANEWNGSASSKPRKLAEGVAAKKVRAKATRSVKVRKKGRTANSKTRNESNVS